MKPIVRHIKSSELYEWDGERFTNLRTGKSGTVDDETARKIFRFNVDASQIFHDYPNVKLLLSKLNMKADGMVSGEREI